MLHLLAAIAISPIANPQSTIDLIPSDDVWVYPFATSPLKDPYLRCWGSGGKAVAGPKDSVEAFSYSYLKWNLKDIPAGAAVVEAKLILTHIANSELTPDQMRKSPIEARPMPAGFSEATWQPEMVGKIAPSQDVKSIFGSGAPEKQIRDKDTTFAIDLLKGPGDFKKYFGESLAGQPKELAIALTSTIDPSDLGRGAIYKVYSKDGAKESRPVLRIRLQPSS